MIKRLALIPARGGSKRLPRKNILPLAGKPLLSWTIDAALKSKLFDHIYVSTEDSEIANIAVNSGVEVLRRPPDLATDIASVSQVCLHHIASLASNNLVFDHLYCLYPTAPLRSDYDLQQIASIFDSNINAQAVIGVTEYSHYPFQALQYSHGCELKPFWPELVRKRSSDLPQLVAGNGSTYAITIEAFKRFKDFYLPEGMYPYLMNQISSIDVDTYEDYQLLQACFSILSQNP